MFWDESQLPLAIFILKVVKCWCKFHQVTCWCFSSNRCSSIDAHAWGMFPSMREQSQALWVPWGWAVRQKLEVPADGGSGAPVAACLPLTHWSCTTDWFSAPLFSKMPVIPVKQLFLISFPVYTIGFNWVPRGSTKSEVPAQHRAPLTSGFRRRQSWMRNSFLPGISCLGPGKVVRDSNLNYKFSVSIKMPPR